MTDDSVSGAAPLDWDALKPPEMELAKHAAVGEFWTPKDLDCEPQDIDPSKYETWGSGREIRARVIRHLAVGDTWPKAMGPSTAGTEALLVRGARITGCLNLRGVTLKRDIWFEKCAFDEIVQLSDSKTKTLSFLGSHLTKGLRAKRATIKGSLYLTDGFVAEGEVNLEDVTIERNLDCGGGKFIYKKHKDDEFALMADNARIGGDVRLNVLSSGDAIATAPNKNFVSQGGVHFVGATVTGDFDCSGGSFCNGGGVAIKADGISCRNLHLGANFTGEVNFTGVRTKGQVVCIGGKFLNEGKLALGLRFADIGSGLLFDNTTDGNAKRAPACIRGQLDLHHATCRGFRDSKRSWPKKKMLLLDGFTYERFDDCATNWKTRRKWLELQPNARDGSLRQQPWTQAIKVLRDMGYERDSVELAVCRERALADRNGVPVSLQIGQWKRSTRLGNPWKWLLWVAVGYGYKPWRALWWSAAIILFSWLTFALAGNLGYMAPREGGVVAYLATGKPPPTALPEHYTEFNAFIYAVDVYLPVIELRQNLAWEPGSVQHGSLRELAPDEGWFECTKRLLVGRNMNWEPALPRNHPSCSSSADSGLLGWLAALTDFAFRHGFHRFVYWFEEVLGWIFITLLVTGLSGIMKKE